jgi:hypothetical protein
VLPAAAGHAAAVAPCRCLVAALGVYQVPGWRVMRRAGLTNRSLQGAHVGGEKGWVMRRAGLTNRPLRGARVRGREGGQAGGGGRGHPRRGGGG